MCGNKSCHSIILKRYCVVWILNDRLCVDLCIRKIYNADMNRAAAQSRRMCSKGTKSPENKNDFYCWSFCKCLKKGNFYALLKWFVVCMRWECMVSTANSLSIFFFFQDTLHSYAKSISNQAIQTETQMENQTINFSALTFWRRASCDTHVLNIPWIILNAFGPNSLKYSLKCSHEAFIISRYMFDDFCVSSCVVYSVPNNPSELKILRIILFDFTLYCCFFYLLFGSQTVCNFSQVIWFKKKKIKTFVFAIRNNLPAIWLSSEEKWLNLFFFNSFVPFLL